MDNNNVTQQTEKLSAQGNANQPYNANPGVVTHGNAAPGGTTPPPFNGNASAFRPNIQNNVQMMGYQQQGYTQPGSDAKPKKKMSKKAKNALIASLISAAVIGGGVGSYFMFFTPEKRLERNLDKASEAVAEERYNDAIDAYGSALKIDEDCVEAMYGTLSAYEALDDADGLKDSFDKYRADISGMEQSEIDENIELIVDIYTMADEAYPEDINARITALEEGFAVTNGNNSVRTELIDEYFALADEYEADGDYEKQVEAYNNILDKDSSNSDAAASRKECLEETIEGMIELEQFDEANAVIDTYSESVQDVDFAGYKSEIEKLQKIIAAKHNLMDAVYNSMASGDFEKMLEIDGSEDSVTVVNSITDTYIYTPGGITENYTGVAAGIYFVGDGSYYFYYGDYVDGVRSGNGVSFMEVGIGNKSYKIYDGEWANDMPNGHGVGKTIKEGEDNGIDYDYVVEGNFTDGLQDGEMTGKFIWDGLEYVGTWTATAGDAPDISEQYPEYADSFTLLEYRKVYALYRCEENGELWCRYLTNGYILGAVGYGTY